MVPYAATTEGITVTVRPVYLEGQSDPLGRRFVFGYFVEVENGRETEVQLLRRHWRILDGEDPPKEVEGPGVVGQQPVIPPGGAHRYNSFCVLEHMEGSMEGSYLLQRPGGERLRVVIPRFHLRARAN